FPANITGSSHTFDNHIPAPDGILRIPYRRIDSRSLEHTHQNCGLRYVQLVRRCIEICTRGRFDTECIVSTKINRIEIHRDDFLLGVITLKAYCGYPFLEFLDDALASIPRATFRK